MNNETRMKIERLIVGGLIDMALAEGWDLDSVYDSEEHIATPTKQEAMDAIFAVDDSTVRFRKNGSRLRGVLIVLGNGDDVISDYSYPEADPEGWNGLMERVSAWVDDQGYLEALP